MSEGAPTVRLQLLRTPQLLLPGGAVRALNRHDALLLALLAVDGATSRDRVVALLWPDAEAAAARNMLRQRLFRLRRTAGAEVVQADPLLRLAPGVEHDLAAPEAALRADPAALAGDLLDTQACDELPVLAEWLEAARASWRQRRRDALAGVADEMEAAGRIAAALVCAERRAHDEPLAEHAQRRLMRLHYRRGDRAAAVAVFDALARRLDAELGETPARETRELLAQIEASDAPAPAGAGPPPLALLRPPRLVGRQAAWAQLELAWAAHQPLLLLGEPGIGKTRLLGDFAAAHAIPLVPTRPGDDRVPHALAARVLRALLPQAHRLAPTLRTALAAVLPELADGDEPPAPALRLRQACEVALASSPVAGVAVDDLQFADAASLELLLALAHLPAGPRWLLASRVDDAPAALAHGCSAPGADGLRQLVLEPLSGDAVAQLLAALALPGLDASRWAGRVHAHSGGNPMFILETLLALRADGRSGALPQDAPLPLPDAVRPLIQRRLAQLAPSALKLARVAVVAGADFDVALAGAVLQQHPLDLLDDWRALEAAHVFAPRGFVHDLVAEAVQHSLPQPLAQWLHGAVAQAMAQAPVAAAPERIAPHWQAAGSWAQAAQAWQAAAQQAYAASHQGQAAPLYARAAEAFAHAGDGLAQQRALREQVVCHVLGHELDRARDAALRLQALAQGADESAWALDRLGEIANMGRADAEAEHAVRAMLDAARGSSNRWLAFNGTRKLAVVLAHQGRHDEAQALFDSPEQQAWIEAHAAEWNVHVWLSDQAYALELADRRTAALDAAAQALQAARQHRNWMVAYAALRNRALTRYWQGEVPAALHDAEVALRLGERLNPGMVRHNPREATRRAMLLRDGGRHAEALALLEASVAALAEAHSPYWQAFAEDQLALSWLALGQLARALKLLQAEPACAAPEAHAGRALVRAQAARAAGQRVAIGVLTGGAFAAPGCPARLRLLGALEALRSQPPVQAVAAARAVADEAAARELPGIARHAQLLAAWAAAQAGQHTQAQAALAASLQADGVAFTGLSPAEVAWLRVQSLDALGDRPAADAWLRRAGIELHAALAQVPEPFRDSFLQRQPVHRALLAAGQRCR